MENVPDAEVEFFKKFGSDWLLPAVDSMPDIHGATELCRLVPNALVAGKINSSCLWASFLFEQLPGDERVALLHRSAISQQGMLGERLIIVRVDMSDRDITVARFFSHVRRLLLAWEKLHGDMQSCIDALAGRSAKGIMKTARVIADFSDLRVLSCLLS